MNRSVRISVRLEETPVIGQKLHFAMYLGTFSMLDAAIG